MTDKKTTIVTAPEIAEMVVALADAILQWDDIGNIALIGVRSRGVHLARRLQAELASRHQTTVPLGILDITLYRDDLGAGLASPLVRGTEIDFNITGLTLVLVDDVLYTGRTVRAALDQLIDFGRPRAIKLAVLIDRGLRELPIAPDAIGKVVTTAPGEDVDVLLEEQDGCDEVRLVTET